MLLFCRKGRVSTNGPERAETARTYPCMPPLVLGLLRPDVGRLVTFPLNRSS